MRCIVKFLNYTYQNKKYIKNNYFSSLTDPRIVDSQLADMQKKDLIFTVDKPFIFTVQENKSKQILLMGKINNPAKTGQ